MPPFGRAKFDKQAFTDAARQLAPGQPYDSLTPQKAGGGDSMRSKRWRPVCAAIVLGVGSTLGGCASTAPEDQTGTIVWPRLERFSGDAEFARYLKNVQAARRVTRTFGAADGRIRFAQAETGEAPAEECLDIDCVGAGAEEIVVTGARITSPASPSITNNQKSGVDEGDIVKLIGRHLVILQDGRLFSIDLGDKKGAMRVAGRTNVYDDANDDAWYDEVVVNGDLIAVLGYSYARDASEVTVLRLRKDGGFTRLDKFFITSEDYYDDDNYATRLIDNNLVLYTPIDLYWAARNGAIPEWPAIRLAADYGADGEPKGEGRPLLAAIDIYKPVQTTVRPVLHAVTVCPLGRRGPTACRTRGVIGPWDREYYVSKDAAFLWIEGGGYDAADLISKRGGCEKLTRAGRQGLHSAAYRLPINGRSAGFLRVSGEPFDQFSLETSETEFRALLSDVAPKRCDDGEEEWKGIDYQTAYFAAPLKSFTPAGPRPAPSRYVETPGPGYDIENRFTETHVVYGVRSDWTSYPPDQEDGPQASKVVAVPVENPRAFTEMTAPHGVIRVERAGDAIVLTGYRDPSGLGVSTIDLRTEPKLAGTAVLAGRYETEGRSHAFNSLVEADGSGIMGIPTATLESDSGRWWWRSETSDVSFLSIDPDLAPAAIGSLNATPVPAVRNDLDEDGDIDAKDKILPDQTGYQCEVSCVDWYGNSRPIFIGNRVFALTGFELIEGAVRDGRIIEIARIDVTKPAAKN